MMKNGTIIASAAAMALLGACAQPMARDSSSLTIVPGVGVSNLVAIGMTLAEMKAQTGDMAITTTREPRWFGAQIPSLGVSLDGPYCGKQAPYNGFINFYLVPPTSSSLARFAGRIGSTSLGETGVVARSDIIATFGVPRQSFLPANATNMSSYMVEGISFSLLANEQVEVMYYPAQGIMFDVRNGLVTRVAVYPKQTGRTTGGAVRR